MKWARTRWEATPPRVDLEPQGIAVERQRGVEIRHGDADVIEHAARMSAATPAIPSARCRIASAAL